MKIDYYILNTHKFNLTYFSGYLNLKFKCKGKYAYYVHVLRNETVNIIINQENLDFDIIKMNIHLYSFILEFYANKKK